MAWTGSKIFMAWIEDTQENTAALDTNSDQFKITLWDNDITPDQTVSTALSSYAAGQWVSAGNEISDGAEWPVAGEILTGVASTRASNVWTFDATDTPSTGTSATLVAFFGGFVYDDTVGDQGICYLYFGGTNTVTDGRLTVIYNALGLCTITA
jgi:hypothetical protein